VQVPEPRDESADNLSLLQKQLILSQVQILELEDVRDELQAKIADRTKILTELQTLADHALREAGEARYAESTAQEALGSVREESHQRQLRIELLQREAELAAHQLHEIQNSLNSTKAASAAQGARIETLDAELRRLKASRSWRWTAPVRSLERLFR
jgi:hypothetical protein